MSTAVHAAIAKRYPAPEWVTLFEVRDDAGFNARRSADVVAMNTWPSRGLTVHGFEVKVSRGDWLRELRNPEKSASIQRYCDRWWVAVSDESMVNRDEVPETWGLLVLKGKSLRLVKEAPSLQATPLDRGFVACLLRNATKGLVPESSINELVAERLEREFEGRMHHEARAGKEAQEDLKRLRERVASFEKASGIKLDDRYAFGDMGDPSKLGAAVSALLSGAHRDSPGCLQRAKNVIDSVSRDLDTAIAAIEGVRSQATNAAEEAAAG